jgi:hypothetical protein
VAFVVAVDKIAEANRLDVQDAIDQSGRRRPPAGAQ